MNFKTSMKKLSTKLLTQDELLHISGGCNKLSSAATRIMYFVFIPIFGTADAINSATGQVNRETGEKVGAYYYKRMVERKCS